MRRVIALAAALLLAAAAVLVLSTGAVLQGRDQVAVREESAVGDPAAVRGLRLDLGNHYGGQLFWDTALFFGETPTVRADYRFFAREQDWFVFPEPQGVLCRTGFEIGFDLSDPAAPGLAAVFNQMAQEAQPWEELERTIFLRDYYAYYPLTGVISLPGLELDWSESTRFDEEPEPGSEAALIQRFRDIFRIPVSEDAQAVLTLTLHRSSSGRWSSVGWGMSFSGDSYDMAPVSVIVGQKCFFCFSNRTEKGQLVDTSLIPGGYGVYCLPFDADEQGLTRADADGLAMVYPLEEDVLPVALATDSGGEDLLLYTREEGHYVLRVLDPITMTLRQRLELMDCPAESDPLFLWQGEGFSLFLCWQGQAVVLRRDDRGLYTAALVTDATELAARSSLSWDNNDMDVAFDGTRLAIAGSSFHISTGRGFQLAVLDESGLAYYGLWSSSLCWGAASPERIETAAQNPVRIRWA